MKKAMKKAIKKEAQTLENLKERLPAVVQDMIDLVGVAATQKMIQHFGGVRFCFSEGKIYYPQLCELLGDEVAQVLQHHFKGEEVYIPQCQNALRAVRNQKFNEALKELEKTCGSKRLAMMKLCPKYGISERSAWHIVKKK